MKPTPMPAAANAVDPLNALVAPPPPDAQRRRLLDYLKSRDSERYRQLIERLGIRK